ncbi:MAG: hypothetical protein E7291_08115 [Lachnospiraceae bacterium]|nr:hypothetical protein [Lachnospiraceae bacterium]
MAMRLSGLMSGMDTESVIQDLVAARRTKVDAAVKAQIKLEWKKDAWKSLNTKLKNLQSKYVNNMRFVSSYSKKTTKVSNTSAVSVITGENAVNGVQSLQVKQLAKTAYLTGAEISGSNGKDLTALSKMSDLGFTGSGTINLTTGGKSVDIEVTADTTISDFLNKVKDAGLNASFDAGNQRFFISAKESGVENDFSLTASDANGAAALKALGLQVSYSAADWNEIDPAKQDATIKEYKEFAGYYVAGDRAATLANMQGMIDDSVASRTDSYLNQYKTLVSSRDAAQKKIDEINAKYADDPLESADTYKTQLEAKKEEIKAKEAEIKDITDADAKRAAEEELKKLKEEESAISAKKKDADTLATQTETLNKANEKLAEVESYVNITATTDAEGNVTYSAEATDKLIGEVEDAYYNRAEFAARVVADPGLVAGTGATKISGQDAMITLNGATFTGSDNVFEINGLTFTALSETAENETVTITTQDDVDGIYDMVKDFLKEYNSIINEMDKLYNADSAKGYEPLTDEEKAAMSETEVEKYEEKIKEALLRRDSNLSGVSSALREIMSSGVEVNGKMMYLSDFGIETLGYFEAPDNEKNAYHIAGDADDDASSGKADVLKGLIASDPDTVISFFSQLSKNLYSKMDSMSKSVEGYRSYGSFFDDKKMTEDYDDYTSKIADLERALADYEDKWYAKFAAMETAMAKMQSNANAVTSLLGG